MRRTLLLTGGPRSTSRVMALTCDASTGRPREVVKRARLAESEARLAREWTALSRVRGIGERCRAPLPIAFDGSGSGPQVVEEFVPGLPLDALISSRTLGPIARRMTDWLVLLARETRRPAARDARSRAAPWLELFHRNFGSLVDPHDLAETGRLLERCTLPAVMEQRDLGPWNVLAGRDRWVVLDWEVAEQEGFPLLDLIYFISNLCFIRQRSLVPARWLAAYRRHLDPHTVEGRVRQHAIADYATALSLDAEAIHAARALHWVIHSASEYRALTADVGHAPPDAVLRRCPTVSLWKAELDALRKERT